MGEQAPAGGGGGGGTTWISSNNWLLNLTALTEGLHDMNLTEGGINLQGWVLNITALVEDLPLSQYVPDIPLEKVYQIVIALVVLALSSQWFMARLVAHRWVTAVCERERESCLARRLGWWKYLFSSFHKKEVLQPTAVFLLNLTLPPLPPLSRLPPSLAHTGARRRGGTSRCRRPNTGGSSCRRTASPRPPCAALWFVRPENSTRQNLRPSSQQKNIKCHQPPQKNIIMPTPND